MLKIKRSIMAMVLAAASSASMANYANHPQGQVFIDEMVAQGFDRKKLTDTLSKAEKRDDILELMSRPAEGTMTWKKYRKIFIEEARVKQAIEFYKEHEETLLNVERETGVDKEIILAIIGVETRFGRVMGRHRVIDALATLAFDYPKRSTFFTKELGKFIELTEREQIDPLSLKGSYAGAMGYGQFMPSSYLAYAVDQDDDGKVDIWNNPVDAIGSVANYFKAHGWRRGEFVTAYFNSYNDEIDTLVSKSLKPELTMGQWETQGLYIDANLPNDTLATLMKFDEEYMVGLYNFYVITRYNHSKLYARAVYELSEEIGAGIE